MTDDGFEFFQAAIAAHDAPAFMRRARDMHVAWQGIHEKLQFQRLKLLEFSRLRLATLFALLGPNRGASFPICRPEDLPYLEERFREWSPKLRIPIQPATRQRPVRIAFLELIESFERFNQRWTQAIADVDLAYVNLLRENYNRYYVMEKECAVRSSLVASSGFVPMEPATREQLLAEFPLLLIPHRG